MGGVGGGEATEAGAPFPFFSLEAACTASDAAAAAVAAAAAAAASSSGDGGGRWDLIDSEGEEKDGER